MTRALQRSSATDGGMAGAVTAHLARHGAIAVQVMSDEAAQWLATMRLLLGRVPLPRVVLVLCDAAAVLPPELGHIQTILAAGDGHGGFGVAEFAVALDRIPELDGAIMFLLTPATAAPLPVAVARPYMRGRDLDPIVVRAMRLAVA